MAEAPRNTQNKRSLIRTSHVCHIRRAAGRNQQVEDYKHTNTHTHIHTHTHTHTHTHAVYIVIQMVVEIFICQGGYSLQLKRNRKQATESFFIGLTLRNDK